MQVEKRIDSRNFDFVLPVHVDIDQINEVNKTCKYISGNINPEIVIRARQGCCARLLRL